MYVGKATSLKDRVSSYFVGQRGSRPIEQFVAQIASIKVEKTDSVLEAVIAEANSIRKLQPKYNVLGKDNRSWNYILITKEAYPRIVTMRQHEMETRFPGFSISDFKFDTGDLKKRYSHVFGPFPGLNTKAALKLLRQLFQFSSCQKQREKNDKKGSSKACLYRQMGQCLGVCTNEISSSEYKNKVIRPLVSLLKGGKKRLVATLERRMKKASKVQEYEEAARLRNQLKSLQRIHDIAILNKSWFSAPVVSADVVRRIEGYDISNLGSSGVVGSMVVFDTGGPIKSEYRKFKIKTVDGQSDVDALEEVLRRRLKHSEWQYPDVMLIDGGKPQVNRIQKVLRELHIDIPIVGIAKGPARDRNDFTLPSTAGVADVARKDGALPHLSAGRRRSFIKWISANKSLLIQVRDEAHRFAIKYQRSLRKIGKR